jgi:hypothetical protein
VTPNEPIYSRGRAGAPNVTNFLLRRTSVKSVRPLGQGLHDLLHLPPFVGLVEDGDDTRADTMLRPPGLRQGFEQPGYI